MAVTLVLTIENFATLENGESIRLELDDHGTIVGRGSEADWCLPHLEVSKWHCEIAYRCPATGIDREYVLLDTNSKNGTFINGSRTRLKAGDPYILRDGDRIIVGPYRIFVGMREELAVKPECPEPAKQCQTRIDERSILGPSSHWHKL